MTSLPATLDPETMTFDYTFNPTISVTFALTVLVTLDPHCTLDNPLYQRPLTPSVTVIIDPHHIIDP